MSQPEAAFVPDCEYDVFLSYAWDDNDWPAPPDDVAKGWVHQFREDLHTFLDQKTRRRGGRVRFFLNTQAVCQQKDFLPQVEAADRKSAVMVALISDAWLGSEARQGEIALFDQMLGGRANQAGRLIPVHIERTSDWPASLAETLERVKGYDGYKQDVGAVGVAGAETETGGTRRGLSASHVGRSDRRREAGTPHPAGQGTVAIAHGGAPIRRVCPAGDAERRAAIRESGASVRNIPLLRAGRRDADWQWPAGLAGLLV